MNGNKNKNITAAALIITGMIPFFLILSAYRESHAIISQGLMFNPYVSTSIYDINGELISELFEEKRSIIDRTSLPDHVIQAFLAAEDQNFYYHSGIDLPGILRALIVDIFSGDIRQGGSTITQQLAKQLYTSGEKTFRRKIVELFIAQRLESTYSKDQILEMYLNQIYFGHGVYGINAASQFYFSKNAADLSIVESALLASIPSAPARNSPLRNPELAFDRTSQILSSMIHSGYVRRDEIIPQFDPFWHQFLNDVKTRYQTLGARNKGFDKAPHFTEYIRRTLVEKFGEDRVYRGGLKVYTTLDIRQQAIAERVLSEAIQQQNDIAGNYNRDTLKQIERIIARQYCKNPADKKYAALYIEMLKKLNEQSCDEVLMASLLFGAPNIQNIVENHLELFDTLRSSSRVEGALIALDPATGGITAMVGGSDFNQVNQINRAVQIFRQPGSAFKAFVYGSAIDSKSISPASQFLDAPVVFMNSKKKWAPSNYEKSFSGKVLARNAFALSLNVISVLVLDRVGADNVAQFAATLMGIPIKRIDVNPSLSLGTAEVSPLEMARGFAVFANNGREVNPYSIRYIVDNNNKKMYDHDKVKSEGKQLVSPETAFIMTSMMRSVVDHGTATSAIRKAAGFSLPAGGKTGTNTNFRDAWFVGFTPDLVAAVWMGCDSQKFTLGRGQSAAAVAAPVWGKFMNEVYRFRKQATFAPRPPGVAELKICSITGLIPGRGCPVKKEYFIHDTEPAEQCNSDHDEMISIFDLIRKRKDEIMEKERLKIFDKPDESTEDNPTDSLEL